MLLPPLTRRIEGNGTSRGVGYKSDGRALHIAIVTVARFLDKGRERESGTMDDGHVVDELSKKRLIQLS